MLVACLAVFNSCALFSPSFFCKDQHSKCHRVTFQLSPFALTYLNFCSSAPLCICIHGGAISAHFPSFCNFRSSPTIVFFCVFLYFLFYTAFQASPHGMFVYLFSFYFPFPVILIWLHGIGSVIVHFIKFAVVFLPVPCVSL